MKKFRKSTTKKKIKHNRQKKMTYSPISYGDNNEKVFSNLYFDNENRSICYIPMEKKEAYDDNINLCFSKIEIQVEHIPNKFLNLSFDE